MGHPVRQQLLFALVLAPSASCNHRTHPVLMDWLATAAKPSFEEEGL